MLVVAGGWSESPGGGGREPAPLGPSVPLASVSSPVWPGFSTAGGTVAVSEDMPPELWATASVYQRVGTPLVHVQNRATGVRPLPFSRAFPLTSAMDEFFL